MHILYSFFLAGLLFASTAVASPSEWEIDGSSRSQFSISLVLQPNIEIHTASDISINIYDRTVDASYRQEFCVRGTVDTQYTVTVFGEAAIDDRFVLRSSENEVLPFDIDFNGDPAETLPDRLGIATPSPVYRIQPFTEECNGATYFTVVFNAADLEEAGSGLYSGSITFLVSPV